jgi:prepilin-type N-terminal cleavage/methylation domain-containing protein
MTGGADMNRKTKKGFTLIELIIVMAIFSILLLGAMMITQPVTRMYRNTTLSEKTYAYANNIQTYVQGRLEYAEDMEVATSDNLDLDSNGKFEETDLAIWAENFRKAHWDQTVGYNGKDVVPLKGSIHIMRLLNNADGTIPQGQITDRVYEFKSDQTIPTSDKPTQELMLNDAFFTSKDSAYNFSYALGSTTLVPVATPSGASDSKGEIYRALANDKDNKSADIGVLKLALTIVLDKKTGGSIDVNAGSYSYRAFADPVAIQIATLPLTNISHRSNHTTNAKGLPRPYKDPATNDIFVQAEGAGSLGSSGIAYDDLLATKTIDFNNDIYFIYAYTDEIRNS